MTLSYKTYEIEPSDGTLQVTTKATKVKIEMEIATKNTALFSIV